MSKAALVINEIGQNIAQVIGVVRKRTNLPISEIRKRCDGVLPILEVDLFGPDLEKRVDDLKSLVLDLRVAGASFEIYRLLGSESFECVDIESVVRINMEMLDNIICAQHREDEYYINEVLPETES